MSDAISPDCAASLCIFSSTELPGKQNKWWWSVKKSSLHLPLAWKLAGLCPGGACACLHGSYPLCTNMGLGEGSGSGEHQGPPLCIPGASYLMGSFKPWVLLRDKPWQEPGKQGWCVSDLYVFGAWRSDLFQRDQWQRRYLCLLSPRRTISLG